MANIEQLKQETKNLQVKEHTFSTFLTTDAVKNKINSILGGARGQSFIASVVSAVSVNPLLAECEHSTILSAALLGESLNLEPSPQMGNYYMVPFKEKDKQGNLIRTVATFQLGWKGYVQLAIRTGVYKKLIVLPIKKGELKSYNALTEDIDVEMIEDEVERGKAETIGYYAMFELTNGFRKTMYWNKEKMVKHAEQYSQAYRTDKEKGYKYSFWTKDFDAMAMKTMLRQLLSKWGILSAEMKTAFAKDMAVLHEDKTEYVDNTPDVVIDTVSTDVTDGLFTEDEIKNGVKK